MKNSLARGVTVLAFGVASVTRAQAHPGHDDGHEFTWELGHLAEHPLATLLCFTVLALAGVVVWRALRRANAAADQSLRGSHPSRGK